MTADGHLINNAGKPAHDDRNDVPATGKAPLQDADQTEKVGEDKVVPDPANDWPGA